MANKVRKNDGSFKYPYQAVLPFVQVQTLMDELKTDAALEYVYRDNKSYGAKLWGNSIRNEPYEGIVRIFRKYISDFEIGSNYAWEREYHGVYIHFEIYIAYAEFDEAG